jgi:hypothetical protein
MVMNTRSGSQTNREPIVRMEPVIQNNPQPLPFPPPGDGDQDRVVVLEAQIESLTQRNVELLQRRPGQFHPQMNRDEHQEDNFWEVHPWELRNKRPDPHGYQKEDA